MKRLFSVLLVFIAVGLFLFSGGVEAKKDKKDNSREQEILNPTVPPRQKVERPRLEEQKYMKVEEEAEPLPPVKVKHRVSVARFDDSTTVEGSPFGTIDPHTGHKYQNDDINQALAARLLVFRGSFQERLTTALVESGRFKVVERKDIHKILREQDFAAGPRGDKTKAPKKGKVAGSEYIVTGLFTATSGEDTAGVKPDDVIKIPGSNSVYVKKKGNKSEYVVPGTKSGELVLHLRIYDVTTSEVAGAARIVGDFDNQYGMIKAAVDKIARSIPTE